MQRVISPRPTIETMTPATHGGPNYAELATLGLSPDEVIDFSASANPFGPSPRVRAALDGAAIERYPDSQCLALRARLAERHGLAPEQIIVGNGTTELIWLLAVAYLQPGDPVLIVGPTFGEYRAASELMGAAVTEYRAPAPASSFQQPAPSNQFPVPGFQPDVAAIVARIGQQRPRLTWLCNPNNPTGVYLSPAAVERVATACGHGLLVLDEAYRPFVAGAWPSEPLLRRENVVLLRSMTKDHALAGLRLGYALAHPGVIAALQRAQPSWSVNAAAQAAGLAALDDDPYVADSVARTHEAKVYLMAELTRLGLRVVPSAANFFLVEVGDGQALRQRLLRHGLVVRDCASFGLPAYVRVGVRRMEECRRLVEAWRREQGLLFSAVS